MSYAASATLFLHTTIEVTVARKNGGYDITAKNADGNVFRLYAMGEDVILSATLVDPDEEEVVTRRVKRNLK